MYFTWEPEQTINRIMITVIISYVFHKDIMWGVYVTMDFPKLRQCYVRTCASSTIKFSEGSLNFHSWSVWCLTLWSFTQVGKSAVGWLPSPSIVWIFQNFPGLSTIWHASPAPLNILCHPLWHPLWHTLRICLSALAPWPCGDPRNTAAGHEGLRAGALDRSASGGSNLAMPITPQWLWYGAMFVLGR